MGFTCKGGSMRGTPKVNTLLFVCCILLLITGNSFANTPNWVTKGPGLFKKESNGKWKKVKWQDHKSTLDALLEHCTSKYQNPFQLPQGTKIVPGKDDMEFTKERTNEGSGILTKGPDGKEAPPKTYGTHCGLDIGSRITTDGGKTLGKLGNATLRAVHPSGYMRKTEYGSIEQMVKCEFGGLRLVLRFSYGHVKAVTSLGKEWEKTPAGVVGKLDGDNKFNSLDEELSKKMKDKGNHIHLDVEGLFDKTYDLIVAFNNLLKGKKISQKDAEAIRRRKQLLNDLLLKHLTK